ncbi:MAG: hypothetical protein LBH04_02305 [Tannerellaceae bacterium]|nr:hypothetical protein [Tannerellaceae bacterium]
MPATNNRTSPPSSPHCRLKPAILEQIKTVASPETVSKSHVNINQQKRKPSDTTE